MISPVMLALPVVAVGIGTAAAYSATHGTKRIHFVERESLNSEIDNLDIEVGHSDTCVVCGDEVDPENVGAIVREDGEYRVVCTKSTCLDTYDIE